jgi:hypothetical protein
MKNTFVSFFLLLFLTAKGQSPDFNIAQFSDKILSDKIKTVQLYKEGWNLSSPVIKLNSTEKLILNFDLLDNQPESYYYTFIHCDKDWNKSDIFPNEYLIGNEENPLEEYTNSFNTTVSYIHYRISFPNERASFKLSGNYAIVIYPAGQPENPVLTQRFVITEDVVSINVKTHRPLMTKDNNTHQQVDFVVNYSGQSINDPYRNVYAFILQNGRWNNAKTNLKPDFYGDNELKYNSLSDKNIFLGGNEFRYFDIKSIRYQSEYVKKIDFAVPYYNVYLYPSENREFKPYFYWQDFNGKYYIAFQEGKKPDTESDYVNVFFSLPSDQIVPGGNIYISGALNQWAFDKNNLMSYKAERKQYECTMLLKQGWYNYEYVFLKNGAANGTASLFEGSHYETENDYTVLIYYRNPRDRYDRVVGTATSNTLNKLTN